MKRKTQITMTVTLDENNTPEAMEWSAPDGGVKEQSMEAFFLSTWIRMRRKVHVLICGQKKCR